MAWLGLFLGYFGVTAQFNFLARGTRLLFAGALSILAISVSMFAQSTGQPGQQPKTAPQTQAILSSYEGQTVTAVEIAGRPNLDTSKLVPAA